jgi:hypothetical protein
MNGVSETSRVGFLEGFFECQACDTCPASILSLSDVEDKYHITYTQGESITVHMDNMDLVFYRRDKLYVGDLSDWVVEDEDRTDEIHRELSLMTVAERESLYTRKEVRKALEAAEFLRSLGYPSEKEAIKLVRKGNVHNIPYSVDDVRRLYDIYGAQVPALRGSTTKKRAKSSTMSDNAPKAQVTKQELTADVMHLLDQKFIISVSSPLELVLICHVKSFQVDDLGTGVQTHLNTLRSRGFEPNRIHVDHHKSLVALQTSFPGVEVDVSGAGDHLSKVDIKIRRLKEMMRSIVAALPFKLSRERLKDLAIYAVSRMNLRRTASLMDGECPKVRFTGSKPDFKSELGLSFGQYVEVYNPRSQQHSNDITFTRTEPCIALYPSANRNGS